MNRLFLAVCACLMSVLCPYFAHAGIVIFDNFSGSHLNTEVWGSYLPFQDSSVRIVNGELELKGGASIYTRDQFVPNGGNVVLEFTAHGTSIDEYVYAYFRSDLPRGTSPVLGWQAHPNNGAWASVAVYGFDGAAQFHPMKDGVWDTPGIVSKEMSTTFGKTYNFKIVDTWNSVDIYRDGILLLSTAYAEKFDLNHVVIFDRPNNGWMNNVVYLDNLSIRQSPGTPTPVPAAVWLLGPGLVGLLGIRRRFMDNNL